MSLHVLAYNLKRVMKIMGRGPLLEAGFAHGSFERKQIRLASPAQARRKM